MAVDHPTAETVDTLGEALPREMARVRDQVMPHYLELRGVPGVNVEFALAMMRADLDAAAKALAEGDVVEMLRVYQSLKETTG
jgi:gamma-glutamylcysteine synthetase